MERLTKQTEDGQAAMDCKACKERHIDNQDMYCSALYCRNRIKDRLGVIEDILGDKYDLARLRDIVEADREKRCAILKQPMKPLVYKAGDSDVYCPNCDEDLSGGWELSEPDDERRMFQCPRCGQSIDVTNAGPLREIDSDFIRNRFERVCEEGENNG